MREIRLMQRLIYFEGRRISCEHADGTKKTNIDCSNGHKDDRCESKAERYFAYQVLWICATQGCEDDVHRQGSIQHKQWVCRIHEALFFVWLECEYSKPEVERGRDRDGPNNALSSGSVDANQALQNRQWHANESEHEPQIEVEDQVADVKVPWFRAVNVWAFARSTKNIIQDNIERHDDQLAIEEDIDGDLDSLCDI